jgi:hypothetical protein
MGGLMNQETHARITTQLALRDTVSSIDDFKSNLSDQVDRLMKGKKINARNIATMYHQLFNDAYRGNLIDTAMVKCNKQKTSKHMRHHWIYLHYDSEKPYTRREEHLIELYVTHMNTKRPNDFSMHKLNVFITRHLLERAALRLSATCIEDMISFLNSHVLVLLEKSIRKMCHDNNGIVLITENEYLIVGVKEDDGIILKTVVPRAEWSKTKSQKLAFIVDELEKEHSYLKTRVSSNRLYSVAAVPINQFNSENEIDDDSVTILH